MAISPVTGPLLFDPKPKEDHKDLFDREKEIEKLKFEKLQKREG
ncbi:hypothetical protein [Acidianus infernus]|nr:hypothetical protein [Acidianus infernus]